MKTAILAASAMIAAPLVLAAPAQATHDGWHTKTCWKIENDVKLSVKMRFNDNGSIRVRVSHPRGTGAFFSNDVARTRAVLGFEGVGWSSADGTMVTGGGVARYAFKGSKPTYRVADFYGPKGAYTAAVRFKMSDGSFRYVTCTKRFN